MGIITGSKHKLYVSATPPATFDEAGYTAITNWELAPCPESIPELVKRLSSVEYTCIHSGTTETARGAAEAIKFNPPIKDAPANPGQIAMKAAFNAVNGSAAELLSIKVTNDGESQIAFAQSKITGWGPGERTVGNVFMRIVEMSIDAATFVEVDV